MEKELRYSRKRPRVRTQMDSGPRATNGATRFEGSRSLRRELPNTKEQRSSSLHSVQLGDRG